MLSMARHQKWNQTIYPFSQKIFVHLSQNDFLILHFFSVEESILFSSPSPSLGSQHPWLI